MRRTRARCILPSHASNLEMHRPTAPIAGALGGTMRSSLLTSRFRRSSHTEDLLFRRNRVSLWARLFADRYVYLMLLPGALYLLVYRYLPMYGVLMAFQNFRMARGIWGSPWVGLANFRTLFGSPFFSMIIANTIIISLMKLALVFPAPVILSLMMNEVGVTWYKRTVQTVIYLPYFLSWVVLAHLTFIFLAPRTGVATNLIYQQFGVRLNLLMDPRYFRFLLVGTEIFRTAGWGTIVYLAALAGVDPNLYEAAIMDGANRFQRIIHITVPAIVPVMVILLIINVGQLLSAGFEQIFVLQNPLVYQVSEILDTYVYKAAFLEGQYALGATVGLFKGGIGLILVLATNQLAKKMGDEGIW